MHRLTRVSLKLAALIVLLSCAPVTKISSSQNPGIRDKTFQKVLIEARGPSPQENIQLEWAFRSLFDEARIPVAISTQSYFSGSTAADRKELLRSHGIDGVLLVDQKNIRKDTIYHPSTSTRSEVRKRKDGSTYIVTIPSGDYTEHVMVRDYGLTLLDAADFQPVWVGSASTRGDFKSQDEKSFLRSLAKQTVKDLAKAGLIRLGAPLPK